MLRTKLFIEEFKKNWLFIILGSICLSIGIFIINANEGRAMKHHSVLKEAFNQVIKINDDKNFNDKSMDYEGKLVHYIGYLTTQEPLSDPAYNIMVQAVKLRKIVEIYQVSGFLRRNFLINLIIHFSGLKTTQTTNFQRMKAQIEIIFIIKNGVKD